MKQLSLLFAIIIGFILLIPIVLPKKQNAASELVIDAPIGLVYEEFNNLQNLTKWQQFMPKEERVDLSFSANPRDVNAWMKWESESATIGDGRLSIVDSDINQNVVYEIENFGWEETGTLTINFSANNDGKTLVKMIYEGPKLPYLYRWYNLFKNRSDLLEENLMGLNEYVKVELKKQRQEGKLLVGDYKIFETDAITLIAVKNETTLAQSKITNVIDQSFEDIYNVLAPKSEQEEGLHIDLGFPTIYYTHWDEEKNKTTFFSGIPFIESFPISKPLQKVSIPKGKYLLTLHIGPKSKKKATLDLMKRYAEKNNLKLGKKHWEVFLNDPKETDSLLLQSRIYYEIITPKKQ